MDALMDRSTTDVAASDATVGLLPTGSTEQHGPALPLGTDTIVASDLAGAGGEHPAATVLPAIPVGVSAHHRHFDGSLWVGEETFKAYVEETVRGLASHGIRRVVLVNGHGGNVGALRRVGRRLRADEVAYAVTWNWWEAIDEFLDATFEAPGGHAGHAETSLVQAIEPDLVDTDRLAQAGEGVPPGWGKRVHGADVGLDTVDFTDTGAVGNPTAASPEIGAEMHQRAVDELVGLIEWLDDMDAVAMFDRARDLHPGE